MFRLIRKTCLGLLLAAGVGSAAAFSLLGPLDGYQTAAIGYNVFGFDVGGPQNLGEEYRWNIRRITYGFDESFLNYFGTQGTVAVNQAIAILNALPPMSQLSSDLSEFPTDTTRENFQASALGLVDLKSAALSILVQEMGLASPERFAWTLRDRRIFTVGTEDFTNYLVIQRNFDPITFSPTPYVNGVLYTYDIREFLNPTFADAVETQVDPLAIGFSSVVQASGDLFGASLGSGDFFIGLTRDDVGGLRYLLRTNNYNIEQLIPGTILTPTVVTNPPPPGSPVGTPPTLITNIIANQVLRPGVDKITFQPGVYDSLLGVFVTVTNTYTDIFVTNSTVVTQAVRRVLTQPDILFGADDLGVLPSGDPVIFTRTLASSWVNNNAINGQIALNGPGIIPPQITITFSKLGPFFFNQNPFFVDQGSASPGFVWGSFDGSTNPPIVYPSGLSIQQLEQQVLTGP